MSRRIAATVANIVVAHGAARRLRRPHRARDYHASSSLPRREWRGQGVATSWNPNPDGRIFTLAVSGNTVYVWLDSATAM
jgi:hypothetical protein